MILSLLLTHLKGSWLFSCFGSLKTRKFIKHILSSVREIDHLFKTLVLPILTYGLVVYGASDSDLNVIQRFLDR